MSEIVKNVKWGSNFKSMHVTGTIEKIISTTIGTHNVIQQQTTPTWRRYYFHPWKVFFIWMDGSFLRDDFLIMVPYGNWLF